MGKKGKSLVAFWLTYVAARSESSGTSSITAEG